MSINNKIIVSKNANGDHCFSSFLNQVLGNSKDIKEISLHCSFTGNKINTLKTYSDMLNEWANNVSKNIYQTSMDHVTIVVQYDDGTTFCHIGLDNSARANQFCSPLTERNNLVRIINKLTTYYPTKLVLSFQEAHRDIFIGHLNDNKKICSFSEFLSFVFKQTNIKFVNKGVFALHENKVGDILIAFGIQVYCSQDDDGSYFQNEINVCSELICGSPLVKITFNLYYADHFVYHSPLDFTNLNSENINLNKGLLALEELCGKLGDSVCIADANLITEISPKAYEIIGDKYLLNPDVITFMSSFNETAPEGLETCTISEHIESFCENFSVTSKFF